MYNAYFDKCSAGWLLVGLLAVILVSGCALPEWVENQFQVGPDYGRPPAPVSDVWIDADNPNVVSQSTDYGYWWSVFNDPVLNELEETAQRQNLPLRVAGMRILEARARLAIAQGSLWPQRQQAYGDYTRNRNSGTAANAPPMRFFDDWDVGFNASWELDIWGRFRRAIESAEANLDAEIEGYDDVLVIFQGEVASAYIQLRAMEERLRFARENVQLQRGTLHLAETRFRNGMVTELDVAQAKENLGNTEAFIPQLEIGIRQAQNALCILLGIPPRNLKEDLGPAPIPQPPAEVIVGIPADLLRQRPDVRQAERLAAAQSAQIGIVTSDFYPRIAITGFIGLQSEDFAKLLDQRSWAGSLGPGFQWNILNYGRIRNNVRAEEARFHQLVVDYQNTVLEANREVENAIDSFLREQQRVRALTETVNSAARSVQLAEIQYREGAVDFQRVIDTQRVLVQDQDNLAESRGNVAINLVAIYKTLGGGWATRFAPQRLPAVADGGELPGEVPPAVAAPMPN
jgi:NodT family efflux transporter outer membrane factor (OMF) lipoprotein